MLIIKILIGMTMGTLLVSPAIATADVEKTKSVDAKDQSTNQGSVRGGMRVFLDPATGEFTDTPSPEQLEAMRRAEEQSRQPQMPPQVINHPDGSTSVVLNGRFMMSAKARVDANGKLQMDCRQQHHPHTTHAHDAKGEAIAAEVTNTESEVAHPHEPEPARAGAEAERAQ